MACNCIKEFNYHISFDTCKRLIYQDLSTWVESPSYYDVYIKLPTSSDFISLTVSVTGVTIIDSVLLGISEEPINLPAGIYCIKIINCNGDVIYKDFLNLCIYKCKLSNLLAVVDLTKPNYELKELLEEYSSIKLLLDGAEAKFECDWCSTKELKCLLDLIKDMLNKLDCNCHG
ncbi:MAG TPA: hypothetical protein PKD00_08790 [Burkholderiales bacterium]|mgnify:CR=1 FL=1|nr:hypothetical protein [Burkholderiales bacterium]